MNEKEVLDYLEIFACYACEQFYPFFEELSASEKTYLIKTVAIEICHFTRFALNAKDGRIHG